MKITKIEVHVVGPEDERYTWSEDIEEVYQSNTLIKIFTDEEIVGVRVGEKLNEILINQDEMKYSWEYQDMYLVLDPSVQRFISPTGEFPERKKIENMT